MAISWFDAKEAIAFGQSLAKFFMQRIPNSPNAARGKSLEKQLETVDKMYQQIEQFKTTHKLNIYKKAKLWSTFKFELLGAGYKPNFVNQITKGLMSKL